MQEYIYEPEAGMPSRLPDGLPTNAVPAANDRVGPRLEPPIVSVVVPTRNETGNVEELVTRLRRLAADVPLRPIVVDDSTDDTPQVFAETSRRSGYHIDLLHRAANERHDGLGGAVVRGLRLADTPWVCVMDADLQHPPELIPCLLDEAERSGADIVVASRYRTGGETGGLGARREAVSRGSGTVARLVFPRVLDGVTDPMSGFFLVRRDAVDPDCLRPNGFKILLEIIVRSPGLRLAEVSFRFDRRHAGESKATLREGLRFLQHLSALRVGSITTCVTRFRLGRVSSTTDSRSRCC